MLSMCSPVVSSTLYRTVLIAPVADARNTVVHAWAHPATVSVPTALVRHVTAPAATKECSTAGAVCGQTSRRGGGSSKKRQEK